MDVSPVVEWLRNLGLGKYEEIFVQQEIDWDALQRLDEEVCTFFFFLIVVAMRFERFKGLVIE